MRSTTSPRVAQLVLAIEHDDPSLLDGAADDRLHQPLRFAELPDAADALAAGVSAGAWCGWLSGSGPTIALLADATSAPAVMAALPESGQVKSLRIARRGAHVLDVADR